MDAIIFVRSILAADSGKTGIANLALALEENATDLVNKSVYATVDWGDGSEPTVIGPTTAPYSQSSSAALTQAGSQVALDFDPEPYLGSFELVYDGDSIGTFDFNATAAQLKTAIAGAVAPGVTVDVSGANPTWLIEFSTSTAASLLALGDTDLTAPRSLVSHTYPSGSFIVTVSAHNYRYPVQDTTSVSQLLEVAPPTIADTPNPVVVGPVLVSDVGSPNADQWNFDVATDLRVLVSSLKMILLTEQGERILMPTYGVRLRRFIFDPVDSSTAQDIVTEIRSAIEGWEPRVSVLSLDAVRDGRSIQVRLTAKSHLNQQRFQLNVEVER